jgi:hypothetical protein
MSEVKLVVQNGDSFDSLVKTAMEIIKIKSVSYCLFTFNGCKMFVKKDTTALAIEMEYISKLQSLYDPESSFATDEGLEKLGLIEG